jgi:type I restriction enzyme S subunit
MGSYHRGGTFKFYYLNRTEQIPDAKRQASVEAECPLTSTDPEPKTRQKKSPESLPETRISPRPRWDRFMKLETFFKKFELFADAPDAVAKMRELVLQLAVRGQLVEQRTKELSARECMRKANKPLVDVTPDELFETPAGWVALPLGCLIASNTGGGTPSKQNPSYWNGSIPWASVKDIQSEKYLVSTIDSISEEGLRDSSSNLIPPHRLIVVTRMGLGKLAINTIPVAINQDLRAIEPTSALDLDFAYLLFKSLKMVGSGVTVKGITVDKLHAMPVFSHLSPSRSGLWRRWMS